MKRLIKCNSVKLDMYNKPIVKEITKQLNLLSIDRTRCGYFDSLCNSFDVYIDGINNDYPVCINFHPSPLKSQEIYDTVVPLLESKGYLVKYSDWKYGEWDDPSEDMYSYHLPFKLTQEVFDRLNEDYNG